MRQDDHDGEGRTHVRTRHHGRVRSVPCGGHRRDFVANRGWSGRDSPGSPVIVAGYDGTSLGRAVVVQAGLRAGPAGCVFVVYAYRSRPWPLRRSDAQRRLIGRATGRHALEALFSHPDGLPDAEYILELVAGRPADAITRVAGARGADAIVVGARPTGRLPAMLRSFAREHILAAGVPVVTVPQTRGASHEDDDDTTEEDASAIPDLEMWWW
jgi:nucleotide-binding universal stress UspA family protein